VQTLALPLAAASFAQCGAPSTAADPEQIPAFKAAIDAQIAPPLCVSVTKNQVFDPLR
jgi:hypothetical protein